MQAAMCALPLLLAPLLGPGCDATRRDWRTCFTTSDCGDGRTCNANHECVAADGGGIDGGGLGALDGGLPPGSLDGGASAAVDVTPILDSPLLNHEDADVPLRVDAAIDGGAAAIDGEPVRVPIDALVDVSVDGAIDTRAPDAPGSCTSDLDCSLPTPYCEDARCVACRTNEQCHDETPICTSEHTCVPCGQAVGGCPAALPTCDTTSGRCVQCVRNDDCTVATQPVCDGASNSCVPCTSDRQCAAEGPGVCMAHTDGHCATDAETIYIGAFGAAACSDSAMNAGAPTAPYCSVQTGVLAARSKGKPLVVLSGALSGGFSGIVFSSPLTVVGKAAVISPADQADGIGITSGEVYLRGIQVSGSAERQTGIGINVQVTAGATVILHMESCTITDNPGGGILLAGAAFDIEDTLVAGNGPGQTAGGTIFGGIRVESLPSAGVTRLDHVTLQDNLAPGMSCASSIEGVGILASGNAALDIASSCGVTACSPASSTCGAQL
jgi:hypothetical protein